MVDPYGTELARDGTTQSPFARRVIVATVAALAGATAMAVFRRVRRSSSGHYTRALVASVLDQAAALATEGRSDEVIAVLETALENIVLPHEEIAGALAESLSNRGECRAAAVLWLYLNRPARIEAIAAHAPRENARAAARAAQWAVAAERYESAKLPIHAALASEHAGESGRAVQLLTTIANDSQIACDPYLEGLCRYRLGLAMRAAQNDSGSRAELERAIVLLKTVATSPSVNGLGSRGFDASWVGALAADAVGNDEAWRDANRRCIEHLRRTRMDTFAFQYQLAFAKRLCDRGHQAAAADALAGGSAEAIERGLPWASALEFEAAKYYASAARAAVARDAFDDAKRYWREAANRFGLRGRHQESASALESLAALPTVGDAERQALLNESAIRRNTPSEPLEALPAWATADLSPAEVVDADLLAFENRGDPIEVCEDMIIDAKMPEYVRRWAAIAALEARRVNGDRSTEAFCRLPKILSRTQTYSVIEPLARLFDSPEPAIRASVIASFESLYFLDGFITINRALRDPDAGVREAARGVVKRLSFPHAFAGMSEIVDTATDGATRLAALEGLGQMKSSAAVDRLIDIALNGPAEIRALAATLLVSHSFEHTDDRLSHALTRTSEATAAALIDGIRRARSGGESGAAASRAGGALWRRLRSRRVAKR